jgi:signal transduction histidine kinase
MNNLRDSGIDIIGEISWGTHISHLYSSREDFAKVLAPFIKSGLYNNEFCIWIYSQNINYEEAKAILQTSVKNIDTYFEKNQIRLLPYTQWYILDNSFNDLRLNQQWLDLIKYAVDNGFDGLRAVGDTAWLEKCYHKDFEYYEHKINEIFSELPFTALCLYDINKISIPEVADIVHNHSLTIISDDSELKLVRNIELLVKERQLAENARKLNEMMNYDKLKTEFFSNISHELRTPLNVILSTIQLMKHLKAQSAPNNSDTKESKYLKIIQQNCYRQLRLVNNLIDISKIDSNYYELHLKICNIVEIVENITMSVAEYIKSKDITLVFDTNTEEIFTACDPDQIERIILNLLSNATKFTNPGGSIWVNIHDDSEKVNIIIRDTGMGIPEDQLDIIFDRFQQVDMSLARNHEGSGIGLSLVKSLVEKHNGNINVKSEIGKGAEFIIELPYINTSEIDNLLPQSNVYIQNHVEKINIEFSDIYS